MRLHHITIVLVLCLPMACIQSGVRPGTVDAETTETVVGDTGGGDILKLPPPPADACIPSNGGIEICDHLDNNCDGVIDENYDLDINPLHCGTCGHNCTFPNASGLCIDAGCVLGDCFPGWSNLDEKPENGCEIPCEISHGGAEVCDEEDNDCDGEVDEGFEFDTDPDHCGGCGRNCLLPKVAEAGCTDGNCTVLACEAGWTDEDENPLTGCESNCTVSGGGVESCDGVDNDCNGITDDGFDLFNDINNCGACALDCLFNNAYSLCGNGQCTLIGCEPGWVDQDENANNGCESECNENEGGIEICDNLDNDCDGATDEPFRNGVGVYNLQLDHCGGCDQPCALPNASLACSESGECELTSCMVGWYDLNQDPSDGCEYGCIPTGQSQDVCNLLDDDCDGQVDEDTSAEGVCFPFANGCIQAANGEWFCKGQCATGSMSCVGGLIQCAGHVGPDAEICDGADNDCDGGVDEGFDLNNNPAHCGSCADNCFDNTPPNAQVSGCINGSCTWTCITGYSNLDGNLQSNGCEYACSGTAPEGTEICDGLDNDCDGLVDEDSDLLPPPDGLCSALPGTPCNSATVTCAETEVGTFYLCNYPDGVETALGNPNQILSVETLCDGLDGDCDGLTDEDFGHAPGTVCVGKGLGICTPEGINQCRADGTGIECVTTGPPPLPGLESCDGLDNDCDGLTDEAASVDGNGNSVTNPLVFVNAGGVQVWVQPHEASHPDATDSAVGLMEHRACSRAGVIPWIGATFAQAQAACAGADLRLCSPAEWQAICAGATNDTFPYGVTYENTQCNGLDAGVGAPANTGTFPACTAEYPGGSVFDLSGNLKEWVDDGATSGYHQVRGGSYLSTELGLSCAFDFALSAANVTAPTVGFRCCASP